jgi:PAS domain S-box-containing protein
MYLEDVQAEIGRLLERLIWVFVVIVGMLALLLLYVVRQSMKIEQGRSRSEAALRESHEKYRALAEVATEGTMMVVDGRCTYFNATMLEMLGYDAEEFLLLDLEDLLPPAEGGASPSPLADLLKGRAQPGHFEARLHKKNGELLEVMAAATPITFAGKDGFILVAKDIGRAERIEGELLGGPHKYQPLADQISLGVFRVAAGRRRVLTRANPSARRLFGVPAEADLSGVDFLELLLDPRERADILRDMEARGVVTDRVVRLRAGAGQGPVVALSLVAVRDESETVKHWDGLAQDVTRQRKLELQRDTLIAELQTSLLFLNDSIKHAQYQPPRCAMTTPIGQAAEQMTRQGSSALFVTAESGAVVGLVTDRDFRERVAAQRLSPARPVFEIMSAPLVTIPDTALVYEAILLMQEQGKRHLAVRDGSGQITGLVTNIALLHFDRYSSIVMTREIAQAESVEALAGLYERLPRLVGALVDSGAKPRNVTRVITATLDAIVNRLIDLAAARLGPPPLPFAFVALGSEGREEKTLVSDQDNAIVYADPPPDEAGRASAYFLALGAFVCDGLAAIGCPYCRGGIMAKTPEWCQPLAQWKEYFTRWIATAQPQEFLEINMFFDFRAMHGEGQLLAELRAHIGRRLKATVPFFVNYAQNALLYKPPIRFFGGIVADSLGGQPRTFNLKDALRPIIGFARLYALQHALSATNTLDRLQQLLEREAVKRSICEEAMAAYDCLMGLRLTQQVAALRSDAAPSNDVDPKTLTAIQTSTLKQALLQVASIQKQIQQDFVVTGPTL